MTTLTTAAAPEATKPDPAAKALAPGEESVPLGEYGTLHVTELALKHLAPLHKACAGTACAASFVPVRFGAAVQALLNQTGAPGPTFFTKAGDGYVITVRASAREVAPPGAAGEEGEYYCGPGGGRVDREGYRHRVVAVIDPRTLARRAAGLGADEGLARVCAIAKHPSLKEALGIWLEDHEGPTEVDAIARVATVGHIERKLKVLAPPGPAPTVLYEAAGLGALLACTINGATAVALKSTFCTLSRNAPGGHIYGQKLELVRGLAEALMLNDARGNIYCDRIPNGIVCYRLRRDGTKTLILLVNSDDFHAEEISDASVSCVQAFKMQHFVTTRAGPRVTVVEHSSQVGPHGSVALNLNMQQNLVLLELAFRRQNLREIECEAFAEYLREARGGGGGGAAAAAA